jgi:hypothetical protein
MLIQAAGPRPATMMLAQMLRQGTRLHCDKHRPHPSSIPKTADSAIPTPPIFSAGRIKSNQMHRLPRSNPHSARGTTTRSPIAVSFLGGFRPPAAQVCGTAVNGRHPKPFTRTDMQLTAFKIPSGLSQ